MTHTFFYFLFFLINQQTITVIITQCLFGSSKDIKYIDNFECDNILAIPLPPKPPSKAPPPDIEVFPDKYWDDMIERRTMSSTSLNRSHASNKLHYEKNRNTTIESNYDDSTSEKDSDVSKTTRNNANQFGSASKLEPRFCEHLHDFHDINCAKNIAFFGGFHHKSQDDM